MSHKIILPWPAKDLNPNSKGHWAKKARAAKSYRTQCAWLARAANLKLDDGDIFITITFTVPDRRRRDDDNIIASFKAGRDGLADGLGVNDFRFRANHNIIREPVEDGLVLVEIVC